MTSYQLTQEYNFQSVLWAVAYAIQQTPTVLTRLAVWLSGLFALAAADLALLISGLVTVLTWCAGIAAIVLGLGWLLANPVLLLAGLGIVGYGWVTYPKAKVQ
ncbi:MAG: hypothetical protein ACOYNY_34980 [Caldilineaceae bacterium]